MVYLRNDLILTLLDFIHEEKINLSLNKKSDLEFYIDNSDKSVVLKILINSVNNELLYDIYSTYYEEHIDAKTIKDIEQLVYITEENRKWNEVKDIEDIWLIIDEIKIWAQNNNFVLKESEIE